MEAVGPQFSVLVQRFGAVVQNPATSASEMAELIQIVRQLKVAMTQHSLLLVGENVAENVLLVGRELLEMGALLSIRTEDVAAFERYTLQLKTYYFDVRDRMPLSQRMYMILGLNLLMLLTQNRIAEFHTELELIDPDVLLDNVFIQYPVAVEQHLMEGAYHKVLLNKDAVPAEEYRVFMNILAETIRNDIADCSEVAFDSLPLKEARKLLFFNDMDSVAHFAQVRNWHVVVGNVPVIVFHEAKAQRSREDIPAEELMKRVLHYARELEQIV